MKNSHEKMASGTYETNKHPMNNGITASKPTGSTMNTKISGPQVYKPSGAHKAGK